MARAPQGWSKRFDEPIVLDDGTTLTTLRQAIEYLAKTVPKAEHNHPSVLAASDHLTRSAEQNYPMFFARMAWEPVPRDHDACRTTLHAYIMALLGFGSGSSVLSQSFDGATEAPGLAVLRPFCKQTQSAVSADWVFARRGISRQRLSSG